jgi:hypothetical protein
LRTTGFFHTHYVVIPVKASGQEFTLYPFGDVHKFAPLHSEDHWAAFLDDARGRKDAYFLGMGDYMDLASSSERNALKDGRFHDSTIQTLEDIYRDMTARYCKDLEFMRGRIIGLIEGNHYSEFQNGTTTTQKMCETLGCKYLGVSAFIRLSFRYGKTSRSVDIWAHHGKGAARLIGGSLNTVQQMGEAAEADVYLMGHDHKKSAGMTSKLMLSGAGGDVKVVHKKQVYARTGSFLRGYVDGKQSYVADMGLNPTDLGVVKITLTAKKLGDDAFDMDLSATI